MVADGQRFDGPAQVQFLMHPSPRTGFRFASNAPGIALMSDEARSFISPTPRRVPMPGRGRLWGPSSPGRQFTFRTTEYPAPDAEYGDPSGLHRLVVGLLNFTTRIDGTASLAGGLRETLTFVAGDWHVSVIGRLLGPGQRWWKGYEGDSAFSHAIIVQREGGATFDVADTADLRNALFHVLGWANGSLVGLALPMGYGLDGVAKWVRWDATVSDGLGLPITWFDPTHANDLGPLIERFVDLARDPFWRQVMARVIRLHVAANDTDPVDASIPVALSALELLAWAHRGVAPPIQITPKPAVAADGIRGLLTWASGPLSVPAELADLASYAASESRDLPAALAGVRNRLVHPPASAPNWPPAARMIDAWRVAMECIDLCLLHTLGHQGSYAHRRHLAGRHVGDVTPVPWALATP